MTEMQEFFTNAFSGFGIPDAVDILIVAFVVYKLLGLIMATRAEQILKGILLLVVATFLAGLLNLHTLYWICKGACALGAVAILIVFQPELRRALEFMGRGKIVTNGLAANSKEKKKQVVNAITKTVDRFSQEKTGALIVFERQTVLEDIAETGTIIDGEVSEQLLGNIFYEGSPLHDGAVIISNGSVYAAGCVLPLTRNPDINKELGTRHRAGIGITENSDAISIIVSEETGVISMAQDGKLDRFLSSKNIEKTLLDLYLNDKELPGTLAKISEGRFFSRVKGKAEKNRGEDDNA